MLWYTTIGAGKKGSTSTIWDISSAVYVQNFSVGAQETSPIGLFFKPDGTKMYIVGITGDDVNEYNLSVAWDVSSASYIQNFSVGAQDTAPTGLFFKPDGTKMYIVGITGDDVNEYNLSVAWDISSAVYVQNFSVGAQDATPLGLSFNPDGTKMYFMGSNGRNVNEYNLSVAWNISSASYLQNFDVSDQDVFPRSAFFKPDGTQMYFVGQNFDNVYEYNLITAWDVTSAVYVQNFRIADQDTTPQSVFFKSDGTKMYLLGSNGDNVYEYTL